MTSTSAPGAKAGRLNELSAAAIVRGIAAGEFTAEAVTRDCLARIDARDKTVRAWAFLEPDLALKQARALDRASSRGLLHGAPIGVKDILDTADMPTQMGSPIYAGFQPPADASVVSLARQAGGVILGKTVTAEFAGKGPGPTVNPHNPAHTPGGSSSGSGAALADNMVPLAFGTQTGGSVLRPAAYCGVVGYKPSYGTFSRAGVKLAADFLDTVGLMTRTVEDAALFRAALLGARAFEAPALASAPRVGLCRTSMWSTAQPETVEAVEDAAVRLAQAGASVREVKLPPLFDALSDCSNRINDYERARTLAHEWAHDRARISNEMTGAIERGLAMSEATYLDAVETSLRCRAMLPQVFADHDVLLAPAVQGEAPLGLASTGEPRFQGIWTLLQTPTISLPTHRGPTALPVGVQLIAPLHADLKLLAAAQWAMERLGSWKDR